MLREIPPNSTVVGIPGRVVKRNGQRIGDRLDHTNLPDPLIETFRFMQKEINELKLEIESLKARETAERNEPFIIPVLDNKKRS